MCPRGIGDPMPCPPGRFSREAGLASCEPCEPGKFCPGKAEDPKLCPKGAFCPGSTALAYERPCGRGRFNPNEGQTGETACLACPAGAFCDEPSAEAAKPCPGGFYCGPNTHAGRSLPFAFGGTCATCDRSSGPCRPGFICPNGSKEAQPCPEVTPGSPRLGSCPC